MLRSIIILIGSAAAAIAAVITDTNITLSPGSGFPEYDYALTINQYPTFPDTTSVFFDLEGGSMIFRSRNLDEGSDWYFAKFGDVFNAHTVAQGAFTAFNSPGQAYPVGIGDFYLGVATSFGLQPEPERAIYGWAQLRKSAGGLELLGSGVSYDVPGIIIGTTMVPEPNFGWLACGSAMFWLTRRRRSGMVGLVC